MLSVLKGTGPGSAAQAARYSLHGGTFHTSTPSRTQAKAESKRNGPIGVCVRSSTGLGLSLLGDVDEVLRLGGQSAAGHMVVHQDRAIKVASCRDQNAPTVLRSGGL